MAVPSQDCPAGVRGLLELAEALTGVAGEVAPHLPTGARGRPLRAAVCHLTARAAMAAILRERDLSPQPSALFDPIEPGPDCRGFEETALRELARAAGPLDGRPAPPPRPDELALHYPLLLRHSQRKHAGAYYTPDALIAPTVRRVLGPLLRGGDPPRLRICDPAMGTGAFLAAALEEIANRCPGDPVAARRAVATRCLHGLDADRTAAALTAWLLWLQVGDPCLPVADLERNLGCGNGLVDLPRGRFDAVLGNPPWDTLQPNPVEFFAEIEPAFRALGKQDALRRQARILAGDPVAARDWRRLEGERGQLVQRLRRDGYRHQGRGKLFTYRLFVEQAYHLLRDGGRLGLLVPSGLYSDREAAPLRRLLLDHCRWEWLFALENRGLFAGIDSRYRFGPIVAQKGGKTEAVQVAFLRTDPSEWCAARPRSLSYTRSRIARLSPRHHALLELRHHRDLEILDRIQRHGLAFSRGDAACMAFAQGDFNMTGDSHLFVGRDELAEDHRGQAPGPRLLPLMQGVMIGILNANAAAYLGGSGRRSRWGPPGPDLEPQFLVAERDFAARRGERRLPLRLVFRTLSNATNARTCIAAVLGDLPCGNSLGILTPRDTVRRPLVEIAFGAGVMGSLSYDWALRQRMSGTNLNGFLLEETVWPRAGSDERRRIARLVLELGRGLPRDESVRAACAAEGLALPAAPATGSRRRELEVELELRVAAAYGLRRRDLEWMLRDCDHDPQRLGRPGFTRTLDPKGFWRVDRNLPPGDRLPVRVLAAVRGSGQRDSLAIK